jgi:hypothetical protein
LPIRTINTLNDIGAELALTDRLNQIYREAAAEQIFELIFKNLSLGLLRTLLGL